MFFSEEAYKNILKKAMMCCSIHNCYVFWFSNIWHQKTLNSLFRIYIVLLFICSFHFFVVILHLDLVTYK